MSRNTVSRVDVTRGGNSAGLSGDSMTDGEGFPPGVRFSMIINERANKSLNRNSGPERSSANNGTIASVSMADRKTGRIR